MKLSNEQRLLVYEELLRVACEDPSVKIGMCHYLYNLLDNSNKMPTQWRYRGGSFKMNCLPELNKHETDTDFWAPLTKKGWETRIKWIEQAIIDVKNKIK